MGYLLVHIKGGGGGGFRPIILETLIMRYGFKGKARTRLDFFRVVLGPCAQFYPREASEQKWGQTLKSLPKWPYLNSGFFQSVHH